MVLQRAGLMVRVVVVIVWEEVAASKWNARAYGSNRTYEGQINQKHKGQWHFCKTLCNHICYIFARNFFVIFSLAENIANFLGIVLNSALNIWVMEMETL